MKVVPNMPDDTFGQLDEERCASGTFRIPVTSARGTEREERPYDLDSAALAVRWLNG